MMLKASDRPALLRAISQHPLLQGASWKPFEANYETLDAAVEALLAPYPSLHARRNQIIIALQEAQGNIARHAEDPTGGVGFVHCGAPQRRTIEFLFADDGPGFSVDGERPPYPAHMVGKTYAFRHTLDGTVFCHVCDPDAIELCFSPRMIDPATVSMDELPTSGLGLAIITKVMDHVKYLSHVGPGNVLWLQLQLPEEAGS